MTSQRKLLADCSDQELRQELVDRKARRIEERLDARIQLNRAVSEWIEKHHTTFGELINLVTPPHGARCSRTDPTANAENCIRCFFNCMLTRGETIPVDRYLQITLVHDDPKDDR